ncbi:MAG: tetratricopeptide repeat protein [Actinomycetota bacterium]
MAVDAAESDFDKKVLERSFETPVVVDFWAAWCAPCRQLGPLLERAAEKHAGAVELVKVDVDANPGLAAAFGVQGIPAVKAFRDGLVVSEFVGAYPEQAVNTFFESLIPTQADRDAAAGDTAATPEEAERSYRAALAADPRHRGAILGLSPLLAARGDYQEARDLLAQLPEDADVRRLKAHIDLAEDAGSASPDDPLSAVGEDGDWEPALERLLGEIRESEGEDRERARQRMLDIFEVLGTAHPLTAKYRSALAAALF